MALTVATWKAGWQNWVFWRGERWRVSSQRLVWWSSDQALACKALDWDTFLDAKRYGLLLTHQEMETLQAWVVKIPKGAISTVTKVMGLLLKELLVPGS